MNTLGTLLDWGKETLNDLKEGSLDALILLEDVVGLDSTYIRVHPQHSIDPRLVEHYQHYIKQRLDGRPVAYIVGHQPFWSLDLIVTEDTLIPRQETERIVELILAKAQKEKVTLVDLGCGSGAIALSLAIERPHWNIIATDLHWAALRVCQTNRERHKIKNVHLVQGDWLDSFRAHTLDIIVANPPYIQEHDPHLHHLKYEPQSALVAKEEGLSDLFHIIEHAPTVLTPKGSLFLEHGYDQKSVLLEKAKLYFELVISRDDYGGHPRVLIASEPKLTP